MPLAEATMARGLGGERLRLDSAFLDGEVAAVLPDGRTSFHAMQTRSPGGANLAYFIFDILHARETSVLDRRRSPSRLTTGRPMARG
jgi:ATP-dependent DNA ligase